MGKLMTRSLNKVGVRDWVFIDSIKKYPICVYAVRETDDTSKFIMKIRSPDKTDTSLILLMHSLSESSFWDIVDMYKFLYEK